MTCIPSFLNIFSASDIMDAVRGRFHFYGMSYIYLTCYSCSSLDRRSVHPTAPVLLTKIVPLGTQIHYEDVL
jgi:hypothetical protein